MPNIFEAILSIFLTFLGGDNHNNPTNTTTVEVQDENTTANADENGPSGVSGATGAVGAGGAVGPTGASGVDDDHKGPDQTGDTANPSTPTCNTPSAAHKPVPHNQVEIEPFDEYPCRIKRASEEIGEDSTFGYRPVVCMFSGEVIYFDINFWYSSVVFAKDFEDINARQ